MKAKSAKFLISLVLLLGEFSFARTPKIEWQNGRVVAAALNGHGGNHDRPTRFSEGQDIWWSYCISTADEFYSVVSRLSPARTGLLKDRPVRFSQRKNQVFVFDPKGKQIGLRILNVKNSGKCSF